MTMTVTTWLHRCHGGLPLPPLTPLADTAERDGGLSPTGAAILTRGEGSGVWTSRTSRLAFEGPSRQLLDQALQQ